MHLKISIFWWFIFTISHQLLLRRQVFTFQLSILLSRNFFVLKRKLITNIVDGAVIALFDVIPEELIFFFLRLVEDGFAKNLAYGLMVGAESYHWNIKVWQGFKQLIKLIFRTLGVRGSQIYVFRFLNLWKVYLISGSLCVHDNQSFLILGPVYSIVLLGSNIAL